MSPFDGSNADGWVLFGSIAIFIGTALHMIRALMLSNAPDGAHVKGADSLDLFGWGFLCGGAFAVALATWGAFFGG